MLTFHRRIGESHLLRVSFSDRSDGDARCSSFQSIDEKKLVFAHQVHGSDVAVVSEENVQNHFECDALIAKTPTVSVGIRIADCVPIALYGCSAAGPVLAVVHAGWRGLRDGVVSNAVEELIRSGCREIRAIVGPHISVDEYEFGAGDLSRMVALFGERVAGRTKVGLPALDLRAAVEVTLERNSVSLDYNVGRCTAQDPRYWSFRSAKDDERFALVGEIRFSQ